MPSDPEPFRLGYRPALDGLRGVSVLAVMLHHSGMLPGGWLGVDAFFALSGFLITTLLLDEYGRSGDIAIRRFYVRRALRLLPGLFLLVVVFGTVMMVASGPAAFTAVLARLAAVVLYMANWAIIREFGLYPFAHTWSLAIEEQFYALWPFGLLLLLRRVRRRDTILLMVGAGIAGSLAWRSLILRLDRHVSLAWAYQGLDTRADSILLGCALAMLVTWRMIPDSTLTAARRKWAGAAAAIGLCLLFATARFPIDFHRHFASTLTALATSVLICGVLAPGSRLARLLEARALVAVGKVSYGLYLWHFPIFLGLGVLVGKRKGFDPAMLGLAWLITFAVCLVSFTFLEQPMLRLKPRPAGGSPDVRDPAGSVEPMPGSTGSGSRVFRSGVVPEGPGAPASPDSPGGRAAASA